MLSLPVLSNGYDVRLLRRVNIPRACDLEIVGSSPTSGSWMLIFFRTFITPPGIGILKIGIVTYGAK